MEIGYGSNVQDGAVLIGAVKIGQFVTIGHGAQLHACVVGDECLIGMNAVLMPGAVVESGAMVAAGAVVPSGTVVKHGEIWGGKPARKLRDMKDEETEYLGKSAEEYWKLAIEHKNEFEEAAPVFRDVMAIREQLGIKNFD
jgi:carbonic anhydrase/acetyltransferase-like protein (isoleucine patch superfamily)